VVTRRQQAELGRQVDDDFFALGGTSIQALLIVALVEELVGVEVPVRILLESRTPGGMTSALLAELVGQ
jgi:phthiocerol/phenolphthiocerol synthesis type-I polyketide synthase E